MPCCFRVFGMLIKELCFAGTKSGFMKGIIYVCLGLLWWISGICLNSKVSMYTFDLGHYCLFILSEVCGSCLFIWLCQFVDKKTAYFRDIGQNKIFIICTHYICLTIFKKIASIADINYTWIYSVEVIIFTFVLVSCYRVACKFLINMCQY